MRRDRHGQVTAEIAVLFTFVISALVFMGLYLQRGTQGGLKGNVDSIGQQFSASEGWQSYSKSVQKQTDTETDSGQCSQTGQTTSAKNLLGANKCTPVAAPAVDARLTPP